LARPISSWRIALDICHGYVMGLGVNISNCSKP
jgi:hypothetical protein